MVEDAKMVHAATARVDPRVGIARIPVKDLHISGLLGAARALKGQSAGGTTARIMPHILLRLGRSAWLTLHFELRGPYAYFKQIVVEPRHKHTRFHFTPKAHPSYLDPQLLAEIARKTQIPPETAELAAAGHEMRPQHAANNVRPAFAGRVRRLTPREQQILRLIVEGLPNKAIALRIGLSRRTVEDHRARIMRKMEAHSLAELVRMAIANNNFAWLRR